jgi:hypothetical protein
MAQYITSKKPIDFSQRDITTFREEICKELANSVLNSPDVQDHKVTEFQINYEETEMEHSQLMNESVNTTGGEICGMLFNDND